jgi:hypothetical protein
MGELFLHNLNYYNTNFNCRNFVETGTGKGSGLSHALKYGFEKIYSIEYIKELYEECMSKFNDDRLTLINDNSLNGLEKVLEELDERPTLFWLDAHFPGADFVFNDYDHLKEDESLHMPLVKEIQTIHKNRSQCSDVFIIDDLQLYEEGPFELYNGDFVEKYGNKDITPATDLFKDTHNFTRDRRHQGFLILTPNA